MLPMLATVATAVLVAGLALSLRLRLRRYRAGFSRPTRRTDQLVCRSVSRSRAVTLGRRGLDLPLPLQRRGQTAFLRLDLGAPPLGRLRDPFIEIQDGESRYRQFFERGASGARYLNLTPLLAHLDQPPLARMGLRGHAVNWRPTAALLEFDPPPLEGAGVVVIAPHPDDAEIAAFGMYADHRSWVVTITAGDTILDDVDGVVPPAASAQWSACLRVTDSLGIPRFGDVPAERAVNLVYPDGALARMHADPTGEFRLACADGGLSREALRSRNQAPALGQAGAACSWNGLVSDLRLVLESARPAVVICPHPLMDSHPDHAFTAVAVASAMRELRDRPSSMLLYAVHHPGAPIYPFGPADSLVGLPPWTDERWIADSLYSRPLTADRQRAKYFAIEAMHGVRSYEADRPRTARELLRSLTRELSSYVAGLAPRPASLLRRGPRPNEVYYVVSLEGFDELVERRLAS